MLSWSHKIAKEHCSCTQLYISNVIFPINVEERNSEWCNIEIIMEEPLEETTTIFDEILRLRFIFLHSLLDIRHVNNKTLNLCVFTKCYSISSILPI